jgi:hypothetical protein
MHFHCLPVPILSPVTLSLEWRCDQCCQVCWIMGERMRETSIVCESVCSGGL